MFNLIFWLVIFGLIALWVVWKRHQRKADQAAGIIAKWYDLRLTKTELIDGVGKHAKRYPLAGLTARVENTGTVTTTGGRYSGSGGGGSYSANTSDDRKVHLMIEGPDMAITRSLSVRIYGNADVTARQFATTLNMASRRQLAEHNGHQQPSPPPSVAAGWYADPNNAQFQRYWDGTRWTNTTAPPVV